MRWLQPEGVHSLLVAVVLALQFEWVGSVTARLPLQPWGLWARTESWCNQ